MSTRTEHYKLQELQKWYKKTSIQVIKDSIDEEILRYRELYRTSNTLFVGLSDFKFRFRLKEHQNFMQFDSFELSQCLESSKRLPFEDKSFDEIVLSHALDITESPYEFIREINRITTDNGTITLMGFNKASLWGIIKPYMKKNIPWSLDFHSVYSINEWFKLLGYKRIYNESISFLPFVSTKFSKLLNVFSFLQRIFFRNTGGIYFCSFKKEVIPATPIKVKFTDKYNVSPFKKSTLNRIK